MDYHDFRGSQHDLLVAGKKIAYYAEGEGEPVLLLHGFPTWSYLWKEIIHQLIQSNLVLAPDLLGYGFSDQRDLFDRSITAQAEAIMAFLDQLRLSRVTLVGHGFGGGVALALAVRYLSRVKKLILLNSVCYDAWPSESEIMLGNPQLISRHANQGIVANLTQLLVRGLHNHNKATPEWLEGMIEPFSDEEGIRSLVRNASALNTNQTMELVPFLQGITVPTLILWGTEDTFLPLSYGKRLAKAIPGAKLTVVKGTSHYLMIDDPKSVGSQLANFLQGNSNPPLDNGHASPL